MERFLSIFAILLFVFVIGCGPSNDSNEDKNNDSIEVSDEQAIETTDENNGTPDDDTQHQGEPVDTDYNPEDPSKDNSFCEYEGLTGYEPGDIVLSFDFCKPLTCKNGKFEGVDGDFCDGCSYWNDPEKEGELGEMMKFSCNGEAERNWCECVKDDLGTKKWACYYSHACQCIYDDDGKRYDLGYEIATDFCQTSTCSDGFFDFLDWEACDHCYYYDEAEDTSKQAAIGDKRDFICPDGSKVDWCECVADNMDDLGQKWKCVDRVDLNCPR